MIEALAAKLNAIDGADVVVCDYAKSRTHLDVLAVPAALRAAARVLRDEEFMVESACALDTTPTLLVVYHFVRVDRPLRVALRVAVNRETKTSPTIEDIFPGANWHEREQRDFFGVTFEGHPDMTPLIMPEEAVDLHPLLKGETELKELSAVLPRFAKAEPVAATEGGEA